MWVGGCVWQCVGGWVGGCVGGCVCGCVGVWVWVWVCVGVGVGVGVSVSVSVSVSEEHVLEDLQLAANVPRGRRRGGRRERCRGECEEKGRGVGNEGRRGGGDHGEAAQGDTTGEQVDACRTKPVVLGVVGRPRCEQRRVSVDGQQAAQRHRGQRGGTSLVASKAVEFIVTALRGLGAGGEDRLWPAPVECLIDGRRGDSVPDAIGLGRGGSGSQVSAWGLSGPGLSGQEWPWPALLRRA